MPLNIYQGAIFPVVTATEFSYYRDVYHHIHALCNPHHTNPHASRYKRHITTQQDSPYEQSHINGDEKPGTDEYPQMDDYEILQIYRQASHAVDDTAI